MPATRTTSGTYDRVALAYEQRIAPHYAPMAKALVSIARLSRGEKVLDVGSGTGVVARTAEPRLRPNGTVVLLDRAGPMIAVARENATGQWGGAMDLSGRRNRIDVTPSGGPIDCMMSTICSGRRAK